MILEILGAIGPKREGSKWGKRGVGEGREGGRRPLSLKEKSEIGSAEAKGEGHLGGGYPETRTSPSITSRSRDKGQAVYNYRIARLWGVRGTGFEES